MDRSTDGEGLWGYRKGWWRGYRLKISSHVIERANQRMQSVFKGMTLQHTGRMLAGAIYNPQGQVKVSSIGPVDARQMLVPYVWPNNKELLGYVVLQPDEKDPTLTVGMTWLAPTHWQPMLDFVPAQLPTWWEEFHADVSRRGRTS